MRWINRKAASIAIFIVGFLLLFGAGQLSKYFAMTRPRIAMPNDGAIHQFVDHGTIVFLTSGELWLQRASLLGAIVFGVIGVKLGMQKRN